MAVGGTGTWAMHYTGMDAMHVYAGGSLAVRDSIRPAEITQPDVFGTSG